jgi:hypothetical protein
MQGVMLNGGRDNLIHDNYFQGACSDEGILPFSLPVLGHIGNPY